MTVQDLMNPSPEDVCAFLTNVLRLNVPASLGRQMLERIPREGANVRAHYGLISRFTMRSANYAVYGLISREAESRDIHAYVMLLLDKESATVVRLATADRLNAFEQVLQAA